MKRILKHTNKRIMKTATVLLIAFLIISQTGCGDKEPVTGSGEYLDTLCEITVYDMDEEEAEAVITDAFGQVEKYEKILSKTIDGSDVDRINKAKGKQVKVSNPCAEVIKMGIQAGDLSDGDFDISIGSVTDLWDFKAENPQVPSEDELMKAVQTVNYKKVHIDKKTVKIENQDSELDLGGIAKGYVADMVTEYLAERGVENAIVNFGGNVVTMGSKEDGQPFVIGIERPFSDRTEIVGSVNVIDKTIVTSGIYERKFESNGVLYHHILDTETGYPVKTDLEAVTVVADKGNSATCDWIATACLIKGEKGAKEFIKRMQEEYPEINLEAAFINSDNDITMTDGMEIDIQ